MVFNSLTFLVFFTFVLAVYSLPVLRWDGKKVFLSIASYVFYGAWNPPFALLLVISTLVSYLVSRELGKRSDRRVRVLLLAASLVVDLGMLGFFKYGNFALDNAEAILRLLGVEWARPAFSVVLPAGISFYTFQTLSYTIDVFARRIEPCRSILDYALYVAFFPQLVAGPILRATDFLPQCVTPRSIEAGRFGWGCALLTVGLFEKVVLADGALAPVVDQVYSNVQGAGFLDAWVGTVAFAGQIFLDFAGYSTCAIGTAMCLGFAVPDNFRFPYAAIGFSDFWRRWHITLSSWLRDYLYIPLGGSRRGSVRTAVNLATTMLLGGLWHGASWRFVAWGALHGLYLVGEHITRQLWGSRPKPDHWVVRVALMFGTFFLVTLTWVFFRAADFPSAFRLLSTMFGARAVDTLGLGYPACIAVAVVMAGLLIGQWWIRDQTLESVCMRMPRWLLVTCLVVMLLALVLAPGDDRAFIYFQF